jgi:DNA-binding LacI/PurR family transcriptional regulator
MAANQKAIAKRLGFSNSTVSRALNGRGDVSESVRQQVLEVAEAMGYQPRPAASDAGKLGRFLVVFCHPGSSDIQAFEDQEEGYHLRLIRGLLDAIPQTGLDYQLKTLPAWEAFEQSITEAELASIGAVVLVGHPKTPLVQALLDRGLRVILTDAQTQLPGVDSVGADNFTCGQAAAALLTERGHDRIGAVAGPAGMPTWRERIEGLQVELMRRGQPMRQSDCRLTEKLSIAALENLVRQWVDEGDMPSAIFTPAAVMSFAVTRMLHACGWRVPDDVSIATVSFQDDVFASLTDPRPTHLALHPATVGRAVAERLQTIFTAQGNSLPQRSLLPMRLVEGESVLDRRQHEQAQQAELPADAPMNQNASDDAPGWTENESSPT